MVVLTQDPQNKDLNIFSIRCWQRVSRRIYLGCAARRSNSPPSRVSYLESLLFVSSPFREKHAAKIGASVWVSITRKLSVSYPTRNIMMLKAFQRQTHTAQVLKMSLIELPPTVHVTGPTPTSWNFAPGTCVLFGGEMSTSPASALGRRERRVWQRH